MARATTECKFVAAQAQALRELYGAVVQLIQHAEGPSPMDATEEPRTVEGRDFLNLCRAVDRVKATMK